VQPEEVELMSETTLTHRLLDSLLEDYRKGAMLFGSEEHDAFMVSAVEWMPALIAAARKTIPGELLLRVRIPQLSPRRNLNSRGHWAKGHRDVKQARGATNLLLLQHAPPPLPLQITITRHAVRLLDDDNAVGSLKSVRDSVADWLSVNDRDPRIHWVVGQTKCKRADVGVVIEIREWRREDERMGRKVEK
jgi:hypothetical protein